MKYKLREWIDIDRLDWYGLSMNPNAIHLLDNNKDKIDWYGLSMNPNAIDILKININLIKWDAFAWNPNAIDIYDSKLAIESVFTKDNNYEITKKDFYILYKMTNQNYIYSYKSYKSYIYNKNIYLFKYDIHRLEKDIENDIEINWSYISEYENIEIIYFLEKHKQYIDWFYISKNPFIFTYDYEYLYNSKKILHNELAMYA